MNMLKIICALALAATSGQVLAQAKEFRIAHVYDKTGPLEAYAKQTHAGLMMGLEYATGGKMEVAGRRIVVIEKDSQTKPDAGKAQLAAAFADDKVDLAIGPTSSGVALAMLPVAEEYKKILLVEPAVADAITGERWNRYVFRTGRSSSQDAIANAVAVGKKDTFIATLAQDYAFGRDGVKAFREALAGTGAQIVHEEYAPQQTTDFTAPAERLFNALKDRKGRKVIFIIWAGGNPFKIADLNPGRYGIEIASGGNILPALAAYKALPGMEGATYYYYEHPKNKINQWLVAEHQKRFKSPPDFFTAGGMSAGIAVIEALKKAGSSDTEKLIAAMEGMSFETPKGRMTFRKEDHQAMQSMYHFKIKVDPNVAWAIPELVREIKPEEMKVPVRTKQ
ncbi:MAG: branched-chain amino acid transport system substrate-binding protein [Betaproteobacteria bacterium]|jgi:branched-chain amino acid transport system substrate-binding protein|nr:branched-chain amino acid transport system substrate-binding protein [Betaproteobacteria bacterium]